jgi:hypothetical protein
VHEIQALCQVYGTEGIPGALLWTAVGTAREKFDIDLSKEGKGVLVKISPKTNPEFTLPSFPARYRVQLVQGWSVVFGTQKTPSDAELTQIMINISSPWDEQAKQYRRPR